MPNAQRSTPDVLPILMYHKVGAPVSEKADTFLNVSTKSFERQMRMLKKLGYAGITFAEGVDRLRQGKPLPRKPVCVTFDDGYTNVLECAAPILARFGWPGTVFVPTAYVGGENTWDIENGKPILPIMTWEELYRLQEKGWEMAGHTRTHPHLDLLSDTDSVREMMEGREDLAAHLGAAPQTFCYPFGGVNARTPILASEAGFVAACTTKSGLARTETDPFLLPRVKIAYRDDVWGFFYRLIIRPRLG